VPLLRSAAAVLGEPRLWPTAARQAARLTVPGWWRRAPFLPLPDRDYLGFRLQTMYGDAAHTPEADDLLTWLRWCRQFDRLTRTAERG
jgi:hypothetical protein